MTDVDVIHDDCLTALAAMDAGSVDAVVTDPPYGLEFMGKEWDRLGDVGKASHAGPTERDDSSSSVFGRIRVAYSASANVKCQRCDRWKWDHEGRKCECGPDAVWPHVKAVEGRRMQEWHQRWATEALRVLKPGGHLLAFGGTRTYHRLACAIEGAGFEIRDTIAWMYGSGFPKSLDVSKAIDGAAGAEREVGVHGSTACPDFPNTCGGHPTANGSLGGGVMRHALPTVPATPEAAEWDGWGTALKPAHEPIVVARKPLAGTVAANVLEHGTGALNIDACRIVTSDDLNGGAYSANAQERTDQWGTSSTNAWRNGNPDAGEYVQPEGRWPANVVLDEAAADLLDRQTGVPTSGLMRAGQPRGADGGNRNAYGRYDGATTDADTYADSGGAARFFYCAKASAADRGPGNTHPTVKPVELMRWLIRLVTPANGLVVDPFAGSGSTGVAAVIEHRRCVLIERDAEYVEIIRRRLAEPIQPVLL